VPAAYSLIGEDTNPGEVSSERLISEQGIVVQAESSGNGK